MSRHTKHNCDRCGASWDDGGPSDETVAGAVERLGSVGILETIRWLRRSTGLELSSAKAVGFHLSPGGGRCHRCRAKLPQGAVVACAQCKSANYQASPRSTDG